MVNVLGCLAVGVLASALAGAAAGVRQEYQLGLTVGLLGGFTTFSTFGIETYLLASPGRYRLAAAYVAMSVVLGLAPPLNGRGGQGTFADRIRAARLQTRALIAPGSPQSEPSEKLT